MSWFDGKTIVAPIDFGEQMKWGIDTAIEIASDPKSVQLIHVAVAVDELPPAVSWDPGDEKRLRNQVVDHFRKEFSDAPYRDMSLEVRFGDPGQRITDYAKEIGADLIVLPSRGRTGLSHLLLGSVAERVARLASCPVLILRR